METADEDILLIEIIKFLKNTPLFHFLTFQQLVEISNNIEIEEFDEGNILFSPESPIKGVWIMMKGKVGLYTENENKIEIKLAELVPEDALGLITFYDNELLKKKGIAETRVKLIYISKESFSYIIENYYEIQDGLINELCHRINKYDVF